MSERILEDGTKLYLGFKFCEMNPIITTNPDFTTRKELKGNDWMILRYVAMNVVSQIDAEFDACLVSHWEEIDTANFFSGDALNLNNGEGMLCANGDILHCLYLAPGGQIMGFMSADGDLNDTYNILIS